MNKRTNKTLLALAGLLLIIVSISSGCIGGKGDGEDTTTTTTTTTSTTTTTTTTVPTTTTTSTTTTTTTTVPTTTTTVPPPLGSRTNPAPIGETLSIQVKDLSDIYKFKITVLEIIRGTQAWTQIEETNMFNDPPKEGFEYILANIRFEYIEGPSPDIVYEVFGYGLDVISNEGKEYENPSVVEPEPKFDAKLYPGASNEGWATFQVAIEDSQPLLTFGRDYKGRGGGWFKLYN